MANFNVLIFLSIWASSILIPVIYSCSDKLQFVYFTLSPVEKAGNFSFQTGKKNLKNFSKYKSIVSLKNLSKCKSIFSLNLVSLNINLNLYLTENNPSFALFLICSFFAQSELQCSYKVCSYKKKECIWTIEKLFGYFFWWNCLEFRDKMYLTIRMRIFNNSKHRM